MESETVEIELDDWRGPSLTVPDAATWAVVAAGASVISMSSSTTCVGSCGLPNLLKDTPCAGASPVVDVAAVSPNAEGAVAVAEPTGADCTAGTGAFLDGPAAAAVGASLSALILRLLTLRRPPSPSSSESESSPSALTRLSRARSTQSTISARGNEPDAGS